MTLLSNKLDFHQTGKTAALFIAGCLWALIYAGPLTAADVRFRSHVTVDRPLVVLGDIAEIASNADGEASALAAMELFPAPAPGRSRHLYTREIRDVLAVRGVELADLRFSGATTVQIKGRPLTRPAARAATKPAPPLNPAINDHVQASVVKAIEQYLRKTVDPDAAWQVDLRLDDRAIQYLTRQGCRFSVSGGIAPFSGSQRFVISAACAADTVDFPVLATVAKERLLVVATRAIPSGHILRPADVRLQHTQQNSGTANVATRLEDVIGKQVTRSLAADRPIDRRAVRSPVLVRRGEPVNVSVRVANVRVTTGGRAMADGSQGDLIEVQALNSRERYLAQVIGVHEVAVYPRRVQVAASGGHLSEQESPAPRPFRSAEPVVAVGHTPPSGTPTGWTQRGSRSTR